jgi:hypothetical protein
VITRDLDTALNVSERLEVGMVGLNTGIVSTPSAQFGGIKHSDTETCFHLLKPLDRHHFGWCGGSGRSPSVVAPSDPRLRTAMPSRSGSHSEKGTSRFPLATDAWSRGPSRVRTLNEWRRDC